MTFVVERPENGSVVSYERWIFVRVGALGGAVRIIDRQPVPAAPAEELAAELVNCLTAGGCGDRLPVPASLIGGQPSAGEPAAFGASAPSGIQNGISYDGLDRDVPTDVAE